MRTSSQNRVCFFILFSSLFFCRYAVTQDDFDYDTAYDDDLAAGEFDYSDEEAAGEPPVDDPADDVEEPLVETPPAAEEPTAPEAGKSEPPKEGEEAPPVSDSPEQASSDRAGLHTWLMGARRHHMNLRGATGLFYLTEAGSDRAGTFGVGFHGAFFIYENYLVHGDKNTNMWGALKLRVTPIDHLELFMGIASTANENEMETPALFQTLGDFEIGAKGYFSPAKWVTLGALFSATLMNPIGEVNIVGEGVSFDLAVMSSFDFYEVNPKAPIRAHLEAGYFFDRSANLVEAIETERGGCGTDVDSDGDLDRAGCLSPIERTALGIDRVDHIHVGVGLDALLPYVTPLIEYNIEIPINRQGFTCPEATGAGQDSCLHVEGMGGMRQWLTFGVRILPPMESLAIDLGADLGLSGYAPSVHELAAQAPYKVVMGLSYNFDPFPDDKPQPPTFVPVHYPPVPQVVIGGLVHDAQSDAIPVSSAVVSYLGHDFNPQVTSADGRVLSYALPPGPITISVRADGYEEASFDLSIPDPKDLPVDPAQAAVVEAAPEADAPVTTGATIEETVIDGQTVYTLKVKLPLVAIPPKAEIDFSVTDEQGLPLADAVVRLKGPIDGEVKTDSMGKATRDTDPGIYAIQIEKAGFLTRAMNVDVRIDAVTLIKIQLREKPETASVVINKEQLVIRKKIHFTSNSDAIKESSFGLMDEIADVLLNNPTIEMVEIQGHTDNRGQRGYNVELSERRANSVRRYLIDAGVDSARLTSKGYGPARPIAPNITGSGRSRNRRVEFHILERKETP